MHSVTDGETADDCGEFDHCNHWIFDAATALAKTSWVGVPKIGGEVPQKGVWVKPVTVVHVRADACSTIG